MASGPRSALHTILKAREDVISGFAVSTMPALRLLFWHRQSTTIARRRDVSTRLPFTGFSQTGVRYVSEQRSGAQIQNNYRLQPGSRGGHRCKKPLHTQYVLRQFAIVAINLTHPH